jgi:hypothetical protein
VLLRLGARLGVEPVHPAELGHCDRDRGDEREQRPHDQDAVRKQEISKPQVHGGHGEGPPIESA